MSPTNVILLELLSRRKSRGSKKKVVCGNPRFQYSWPNPNHSSSLCCALHSTEPWRSFTGRTGHLKQLLQPAARARDCGDESQKDSSAASTWRIYKPSRLGNRGDDYWECITVTRIMFSGSEAMKPYSQVTTTSYRNGRSSQRTRLQLLGTNCDVGTFS